MLGMGNEKGTRKGGRREKGGNGKSLHGKVGLKILGGVKKKKLASQRRGREIRKRKREGKIKKRGTENQKFPKPP